MLCPSNTHAFRHALTWLKTRERPVWKETRVREIGVSLQTPEKIRSLQKKLYVKAKREPGFRFYSLLDKICRIDVLEFAWRQSKSNGGASGVDGLYAFTG